MKTTTSNSRPRRLRRAPVARFVRVIGAALVCAGAALPVAASAQSQDGTVLIDPSPLLPEYDRGRNVSVLQKARPEYDAIGVRRGAFLIFPRLGIGAGATDNVYLTDTNTVGDVFATVTPSITANSDWSRHQLSLGGGASLRRYADESPRNQDEWYLNALSRADIGSDIALTAEAQAARNQESPFAGAIPSDIAALSAYQRRTAIFRGQYVGARSRTTLAYDFNHFEFADITFVSGARLSQADRDRSIHRVTGQYEYALSPSLSVYGQLSYGTTNYDQRLRGGQANRDSDAIRFIAGVNFDLSAFIRGTVGVGYIRRDYASPLYQDVDGPSVEARVEYFPTELTTVTLNLRRVLDDSNIFGTSAFFDNQVALRVDHELRYNVLVNASAAYTKQDYVDSPLSSDIYRVGVGARYLVSPSFQIVGGVNYSGRTQNELVFGGNVKELSGEIGIVLQR